MAERKPLVVIAGIPQELPTADKLSGVYTKTEIDTMLGDISAALTAINGE